MIHLKRFIKRVFDFFNGNYITLNNVECEEHCNFAHHCEIKNSKIGKRTSIGRYTKVENTIIGRYCSISWNATIGAPSHPIERLTSNAFTYRALFGIVPFDTYLPIEKTEIGNDVWIGCNVTILAGVKVGNGAIIGAGSVLTKNVDPYSVVCGVPAKKVKTRYKEDIINEVKDIEWWSWKDETLIKYIDVFEHNLNKDILDKIKKIDKEEGGKCETKKPKRVKKRQT